jgi:hypothetical protein
VKVIDAIRRDDPGPDRPRELAVGELPPNWPAGAPNPWALGACGFAGCWCAPEAQAAVTFAAARLLESARALAAEQDAAAWPRSAEAAAWLVVGCEALLLDALELSE